MMSHIAPHVKRQQAERLPVAPTVSAFRASIPSADRVFALLCHWRRREERDDGPCWHSVPAVARSVLGGVKLSPAGKEMVRGLLIKLVARGLVEASETADQGTYYRAGGAEFAPKPVRVPGPKLFVLQRELSGRGIGYGQWFDAKAFETQEEADSQLEYRRQEALARINGWGGSGYSMERVQRMRVVKLVASVPDRRA